MAASISAAEATPCSSMRIASSPNTTPSRLLANPGESLMSTTSRSICLPISQTRSTISDALFSPRITSSSLIMCGGLKKCMPTTRSGDGIPEAISVMLNDEVLLASTVSSGTLSATWRKRSFFRLMSSGMASITSPASSTPCSTVIAGVSRSSVRTLSAFVILPSSTPLDRVCSTAAIAASRVDLSLS